MLKQHVFNPKTDRCLYCGTTTGDDAVANIPCEDAPASAPDFGEYDNGEVMAYYNLSDEEWDSLSEAIQDKLFIRTFK